MRIAILGTRGIPSRYGGFETFAEELSTRLVRRGHDVTVYCRPVPRSASATSGQPQWGGPPGPRRAPGPGSSAMAQAPDRGAGPQCGAGPQACGVDTRVDAPPLLLPHAAPPRTWRGVRLVTLPTLRHKYFETLQHTLFSALHAMTQHYEVALFCNAANAIFTPLPRLVGARVALNVDGLERNRRKWNVFGRMWYRFSESLATFCPNEIVTDAGRIRDYYAAQYGRSSWCIAYGAPIGKVPPGPTLAALGLTPGSYFLYVSRFEPENNALLVRRAFERVATPLRLALIGDAPYAPAYTAQVKNTADARVLIPGAIYGDGYHELQSHSLAYIHATEVGGTHPALIEAMGRGALVLYLRTLENEEVAGGVGLAFHDEESLAARIREVLSMSAERRDEFRAAAVQRVRQRYSWDAVTDEYERLFASLLRA
jgi:glycosyltransferase involved in cell wall biosynthesis